MRAGFAARTNQTLSPVCSGFATREYSLYSLANWEVPRRDPAELRANESGATADDAQRPGRREGGAERSNAWSSRTSIGARSYAVTSTTARAAADRGEAIERKDVRRPRRTQSAARTPDGKRHLRACSQPAPRLHSNPFNAIGISVHGLDQCRKASPLPRTPPRRPRRESARPTLSEHQHQGATRSAGPSKGLHRNRADRGIGCERRAAGDGKAIRQSAQAILRERIGAVMNDQPTL